MQKVISRNFAEQGLTVSSELNIAQKEIDKCNKNSGCDSYCSRIRQKECKKLNKHSKLTEKMRYATEFLSLRIEEIC